MLCLRQNERTSHTGRTRVAVAWATQTTRSAPVGTSSGSQGVLNQS
jgi:hypothetical protein